jgi:hypothetical protein
MPQKLNRMVAVLITTCMLFSFKLENNEDETTVKALFIYNFTKHIEWPKGKINGKFMIGILGNSPVYDKLIGILKDRKIKDLPVEIKKVAGNEQVEACDILFIAKTEKLKATALRTLMKRLIVTVCSSSLKKKTWQRRVHVLILSGRMNE